MPAVDKLLLEEALQDSPQVPPAAPVLSPGGDWRPGRPLEPGGGGREHAGGRPGAGRGHPSGGAREPEKALRRPSLCAVTPFGVSRH